MDKVKIKITGDNELFQNCLMEQLDMFGGSIVPERAADTPTPDLSEWALVYLVTKSGGNRGNLFILRVQDAQTLCEDECSHGQARGGQWMFQWTTLDHFARNDSAAAQHKNVHGKLEPFVFIRDTGKQDRDFARLGIHKPTLQECSDLLKFMGYELKFKGSKERLIEKALCTTEDFQRTEEMLNEKLRSRSKPAAKRTASP